MAVTLKGNNGTYEGTSEDNKPLDVPVNTEFNELDTGKTYYFDGETWNEEPPCESSGFTPTEQQLAAMNSGITAEKLQADETALAGKVDKETGKGLSANDFTTVEKTKLAGIAEGAEVNEIESIKVNNTTINPDANKVVNITVPTTAADVSALPDTTKYAVALSLTINSSTFVMTGQLKDQYGDNLGTAQTIDLPLESVVVGGSYNSQTKKVVLTLQNGNTIEFSVADLVSGLQTELSASNKLNPAYINYDSTHRAVSDTEKSTWNGKQNALSFDGTYSASTNKAATVSTVTNAVNALDVTGDASVSASKTISAWSETDGKVSISTQDIAIAGTQTTLTGYAKSGTAGQAVAATDNVNQAIGKLEATVDDNKNNISNIQLWEQYDCLDITHPNDIDIDNSELTVYHNAFLKRVVITCKIKFLLQRTSASTALLIGNMANIPDYTQLIPLNSIREFVSTSEYDAFIAKNPTNYAIAFAVNSGTLAANTEIRAQFEYTYF